MKGGIQHAPDRVWPDMQAPLRSHELPQRMSGSGKLAQVIAQPSRMD
jgi:hypothetical protein